MILSTSMKGVSIQGSTAPSRVHSSPCVQFQKSSFTSTTASKHTSKNEEIFTTETNDSSNLVRKTTYGEPHPNLRHIMWFCFNPTLQIPLGSASYSFSTTANLQCLWYLRTYTVSLSKQLRESAEHFQCYLKSPSFRWVTWKLWLQAPPKKIRQLWASCVPSF